MGSARARMEIPLPRRSLNRLVLGAIFAFAWELGGRNLAVPTFAIASTQPDSGASAVRLDQLPPEVKALSERFLFQWVEGDLVLSPRRSQGAVREVRVDSDGNVFVNGKLFDRSELETFLPTEAPGLLALAGWSKEERLALARSDSQGLTEREKVEEEIRKPSKRSRRSSNHLEERVSFGRKIVVESEERVAAAVCFGCSVEVRGAVLGDAVAFGGSLSLGPLAQVHGNAVAFGGPVSLEEKSRVSGDAVAFGGSLRVGKGAEIAGDGVSFGGALKVEEGGLVQGESMEFFGGKVPFASGSGAFFELMRPKGKGVLLAVGRAVALALFAGLVWLVVGYQRLEPLLQQVRSKPWACFFAGFGTVIVTGPLVFSVGLLLLLSIIGIPFLPLLPLVVLGVVVVAFLGYTVVAGMLGQRLLSTQRLTQNAAWGLALSAGVGVLLLQALGILGRVVAFFGGGSQWLGWGLVFLGFLLKVVAWMLGLGAVVCWLFLRHGSRTLPSSSLS